MTATAAQPQGRPWWLTLIMGIAAVAIGGILLFGSLTAQARTYLLLRRDLSCVPPTNSVALPSHS